MFFCLLDSKFQARIIMFTPTVLGLVTFKGFPGYFLTVCTCQHVEVWIVTGLMIDVDSSRRPCDHMVFPLFLLIAVVLNPFSMLHSFFSCTRTSVWFFNSMGSIVYELKSNLEASSLTSLVSHVLGPFSPDFCKRNCKKYNKMYLMYWKFPRKCLLTCSCGNVLKKKYAWWVVMHSCLVTTDL